jgi:hypothetical protein
LKFLLKEYVRRDGDSRLNDDYNRYAEHKFYVFCFMPYYLHGDKHSNRAAESGKQQKCCFSGAVLGVMLCSYLVVDAHDDRDYGNGYEIANENFEKHNKASFL